MPFIFNLNKKSPLHICNETQDSKTAEIFVKNLAKAPLDHHSRVVVDVLPLLFQYTIPSLPEYFDSRLKQTIQI